MIEKYTEQRAQITRAHAREDRRDTDRGSVSSRAEREQK